MQGTNTTHLKCMQVAKHHIWQLAARPSLRPCMLPYLLCQEPSASCNTFPQELDRFTKVCKSITPAQK